MKLQRDFWLTATLLSFAAGCVATAFLLLSLRVDWDVERRNRISGQPRSHLPEPGAMALIEMLAFGVAAVSYRRHKRYLMLQQ